MSMMRIDGEFVHPVAGFNDYFISETATIYRKKKNGKVASVTQFDNEKTKCMTVQLQNENGKYTTIPVRRLMLLTFKGEPLDKKMEAIHLDGDYRNCVIENLEWRFPVDNPKRPVAISEIIEPELTLEIIEDESDATDCTELSPEELKKIDILKNLPANKVPTGELGKQNYGRDNGLKWPLDMYERYITDPEGFDINEINWSMHNEFINQVEIYKRLYKK